MPVIIADLICKRGPLSPWSESANCQSLYIGHLPPVNNCALVILGLLLVISQYSTDKKTI